MIDRTDARILSLLMRNGKIPVRKIAEILGLGESTVHIRLRKLEEIGVLKGYSAVIDMEKLGLRIKALLQIDVDPTHIDNIAKELAKNPHVMGIYSSTGEFNLMSLIISHDPSTVLEILEKITNMEGVRKTNITYLLRNLLPREINEVLSDLILLRYGGHG